MLKSSRGCFCDIGNLLLGGKRGGGVGESGTIDDKIKDWDLNGSTYTKVNIPYV